MNLAKKLALAASLTLSTAAHADTPQPATQAPQAFTSETRPTSSATQQTFLAASKVRCAPANTLENAAVLGMAASALKNIETALTKDVPHYLSAFEAAPEYFAEDKSPKAAVVALAIMQMNLQAHPMHNCDPQNRYGDSLQPAQINKELVETALASDALPPELRVRLQKIQDNLLAGSEERYLKTIADAKADGITTSQEMFDIMAAERDMTNGINDVSPVMMEQTAVMLDRIGVTYTQTQLKAISSGIEEMAGTLKGKLDALDIIMQMQRGGPSKNSLSAEPIMA